MCASCGQIDKSHAYEYLILFVKENGEVSGSAVSIASHSTDVSYWLTYDAVYDNLDVSFVKQTSDELLTASIDLDTYAYSFDHTSLRVIDLKYINGYLTPSTFTVNSPITYTDYYGPVLSEWDTAELARVSCCDLLDWLTWCLSTYNAGITIADLGFTAY